MRLVLAVVATAVSASAMARDTYVRPHVRNDGTYVEGHYRSAPNSSRIDNYSTQGNQNPYTGKAGTQDPYPAYNSGFRDHSPSNNNNGLYDGRRGY